MSVATYAPGQPAESRGGGSLYDVIDLILDKGLVIDAFVRVSLVGIEILTIDARIVVASVDTYLRFAEATGRLHLDSQARGKQPVTLPDVVAQGKGLPAAGGAAGGVLSKAKETVQQAVGGGEESGSRGDDEASAGRQAPAAERTEEPVRAARQAPAERQPPSRGST